MPTCPSSSATAPTYPKPDGKLIFDKLSSVYLSGNRTRDDAPSHIRGPTASVRREVAEAWVRMCPAQVYEIIGDASPAGNVVDVEVTAANCVQCGAITAKGGRLDAGRGGVGPRVSRDVGQRVAVDVVAASAAIGNRLKRTPLLTSATLGGL